MQGLRTPRFLVIAGIIVLVGLYTLRFAGEVQLAEAPSEADAVIARCLDQMEAERGSRFPVELRNRMHGMTREPPWNVTFAAITKLTPEEQKKRVDGLARIVLVGLRESFPAPKAITQELLQRTSDEELWEVLSDYTHNFLRNSGAYHGDRLHDAVCALPRGLRIVHLLGSLDGGITIDGFHMHFDNTKEELLPETLEELRFLGAVKHVRIVELAVVACRAADRVFPQGDYCDDQQFDRQKFDEAWEVFRRDHEPIIGRLEEAYYRLEKTEDLNPLVVKYIREHPESVIHP